MSDPAVDLCRYDGYTLEMWSLGVTLFTLLCGENPFHDVDDTISKPLRLPAEITPSEYRTHSMAWTITIWGPF